MKRDLDVIRQILFAVENGAKGQISIPELDNDTVAYHVRMLIDANFIAGSVSRDRGGLLALVSHLTWDGHDFLDAARDDDRWTKTKTAVKEKGGSVAFDVVKQLLSSLAKVALGIG